MPYRIAHQIARRTSSSAALLTVATLAALAAFGTTARAQAASTPARPSVTGMIGIGVATTPRYTGSDEYRVVPVPIAQLLYRGASISAAPRAACPRASAPTSFSPRR